jgi:pimeloyl-ACP methyl ester carboxylesterase
METQMQVSSEFVTTQGVRLHVRRKGSGRPMVFLHGAGGVPAWSPFLEGLACGHALVVPDHPGFGVSGDAPHITSIPELARFYAAAFQQLGLSGIDLVGHSLGGWLAAEIAALCDTRLRTLNLMAPAGLASRDVTLDDVFHWTPEELVRKLYADEDRARAEIARQKSGAEIATSHRNAETFVRLAKTPALHNPALARALSGIRTPVRILWGEEDHVIPIRVMQLWLEAVPAAKGEMLPRCGHLPQVECCAASIDWVERSVSEDNAGLLTGAMPGINSGLVAK